ncbi:hypothetical protein LPJ57_005831, partial [Coemansia sp. RSA 486]
MSDSEIIKRTEDFVREYMGRYDCSHDWEHVNRVVKQALALSRTQPAEKSADTIVVHLAALLHDVDDAKYRVEQGSVEFSSEEFLVGLGLDRVRSALVCRVVDAVSFRKELQFEEQVVQGIADAEEQRWRQNCVELACVQDADRLDAIGAFGVLRCAAFSGARNRPLFIPNDSFIENISYNQYVNTGNSKTATA